MNKISSFLILTAFAAIGLTACGDGEPNVNSSAANANMRNANMANSNLMNANTMNSNAMMNANASNVARVQDNFWTQAAYGGMAEVELGRLAATKAQNAEVKKFASMMVADHTKANAELKTLAAKKSVVLPTELDSDHKSLMEDLNGLSGAEFDKRYVDAMVEDHEETIELFENNADNDDADIKAFAAKTLPALKSHFEMIKGIQSKMK